MIGERTLEGWVVRLRPHGIGRFFTAAFLGVWLCGWAAGEAFAIWLLVKGGYALLTGTPPDPGRAPLQLAPALAMGAFLLFWLTIWTVGGIGAIAALLQALWAEDRLTARSTGLTFQWFRGPFRGRREFPRDRIRGVGLTPQSLTLVVETDRERVELTGLGTPEEREGAAVALRSELALPESPVPENVLPKGWQEIITPEGERAVVADTGVRRAQARVATLAALGLSAIAFLIVRESGRRPELIPMAVLTAAATGGLAWGAAWLAYGRTEFRIGSGAITFRRRFRWKVRDLFEARRLEVTVRSDSDGDDWFELEGLAAGAEAAPPERSYRLKPTKHRRTIVSFLRDPTVPTRLGAWMARAANVPIADRTTREAREADVALLVQQLDSSGRLGRAAASWIRKAQERRPKNPRAV